MNYIYTVTTIRLNEPNEHERTVAWYSTQEAAFNCLDKNLGDLIESGYYQYGVVEKVREGLYPDTCSTDGSETLRWFWKAVGETHANERWERLESEPDELSPKPGTGACTSYCQIG